MQNEAEVTQYIAQTFPGVAAISAPGGSFFFYNPGGNTPDDRRFPFVTLTINDDYDTASDLTRPGIFRLNIGVSKETYRKLFGEPPASENGNSSKTDRDFTAIDTIMPHPVYASQSWVCVLNPGAQSLDEVKDLLAEAYEIAVQKHDKRAEREK